MSTSLTDAQIDAVASQLITAHESATPIDELLSSPESLGDAYRIQTAVQKRRAGRLVGWKAGVTARRAQEFFGIDTPIAGRYADGEVSPSGVELRRDRFATPPHVEVEVGLRIVRDIFEVPEDPLDLADFVVAFAAIEIVSGRLGSFPVMSAPDMVADNVVGAGMIVGAEIGSGIDGVRRLDEVAVSLDIDGETVASGSGRDALGHPLIVLAWIAAHAAGRDAPLCVGDMVITGTCTGLVPARTGAHHVGRVGDATVSFDLV